MPAFFPSLKDDHQEWIMKQPVFFIASAPLNGRHINVSPKGHPSRTLRILNPNQIAYLDHTGSGCETIAHMYEPHNGRLTVMLNSFTATPRIMRLFCTGRVVEAGCAEFEELYRLFDPNVSNASHEKDGGQEEEDEGKEDWQIPAIRHGARSIILLDIFKVQTSCGYGVPIVAGSIPPERAAKLTSCERDESGCWLDRETLGVWANSLDTEEKFMGYIGRNNVTSLDGLPGSRRARRAKGEWIGGREGRLWIRWVVSRNWAGAVFGFIVAVLAMAALGMVDQREVSRSWQSWNQTLVRTRQS